MSAIDRFTALKDSPDRTSLESLFALYDSLEALPVAFMQGEWDGGVFNTGHPGEKMLGRMNWRGKTFRGDNDVDPIVCHAPDGGRAASDVMGKASLRSVAYRDVVTATMVYDNHPIFDHFRKVDDDTVLGVMDRKGDEFPLFFWLRRF